MTKDMAKKTITVIAFIFFLVLTGKLLRYALNDDTSSYTRVTFHEMYAQDNIDVLFLGTSHCMHSFDPALLDKELGMNTFNAASSSQTLDGSLMVLKEAVKSNRLKHVYLDLFYNSSYDVHKERTQMTSTYIISDYLKPSIDKYIYLLRASGSEHYANSFIVARRSWNKIFEPAYISDLIKKKNTHAYKSFGYDHLIHENSAYSGKGYIKNFPEVKDWDFFDTWGWSPVNPDTFSKDYKNDLLNIIGFCKDHNIELTLVNAPTSDFCLTAVGDYDEYLTWIRSVADSNGIEYYDFNLCREEFFPSASDVFIDPVHLNQKGAGILAGTFSALVNKNISEEEMFYNSYREKLNDLEPNVFGVSFMNEYSDDGSIIRNCRIVSNKPEKLEYKISVIPEGSAGRILRDYDPDPLFSMDPDITGIIAIYFRSPDGGPEGRRLLTVPKQ